MQHPSMITLMSALLLVPAPLAAQADPSCTYDACALRIESTFFGGQYLARGVAGARVAPIAPFSTSVTRALAGVDSAMVYAATYDAKFRWGTSMAIGGSAIGAVTWVLKGDDFSEGDIAFTITGWGIALVGGWLVTSGMRDLSRALWWYNRQFAETPE